MAVAGQAAVKPGGRITEVFDDAAEREGPRRMTMVPGGPPDDLPV